MVEGVYYGSDGEELYVRIDAPRTPAELEAQHIDFWLYCSGKPAGDGASDIDLPLPESATVDLGFEPAYAVRIVPRVQGGSVTVARIVAPSTRGVVESAREWPEPDFLPIPFA